MSTVGNQNKLGKNGIMKNHTCCRVALTGGPGGGKTTAADLFRRELGEKVVVVREAATLLYSGGFPRSATAGVKKATQRAIYHVQRNLEDAQADFYQGRILLCDRGTVDSAAYWPGRPESFFKEIGTSLEEELSRYDAVVFFETAAVGGHTIIEGGNPARVESNRQAVELDRKLRALWSKHPHFHLIRNDGSFFKKMQTAFSILKHIVSEHQSERRRSS